MLSQKTINEICDHAAVSELARISWADRGRAPIGYVKGMAACYGLCLQKLMAGDSAAQAMVRVVEDGKDVFDHYAQEFADIRMETAGASDVDRLRALFVVLTGLGMRESSGRYCCGRDTTAKIPPSSDTVEAGLFQQSWDSRRASPEIARLLASYSYTGPGIEDSLFFEGVKPRNGDLENYGSGDGKTFQNLCKMYPTFAAQVAALGLRTLYTHWGPIVRHEVELVPAANGLFLKVQEIVGANAPVVAQKPAAGWVSVLVAAVMAMFRKPPAKPAEPPAPAKPIDTTPAPWMPPALRELGFHEVGQNRGIEKYIEGSKAGSVKALLGQPWCAVWINWGLETVGIPGSRSAMARSFESNPNFVKLAGPAYGAITTMWRGSVGSGLGHVFFYLGENEKGILALGGNQSDQVCRQYEPRNRIVGYFWPRSQPLPKVGKIIVTADAKEGTET